MDRIPKAVIVVGLVIAQCALAQDQTAAPIGKVYEVGGSVKPPVALKNEAETPSTEHEIDVKENGTVSLQFIIDEVGTTRNIQIIRSTSPDLRPLALASVAKLRFRPATKDGKPVAVRIYMDISFKRK